MKVKVIESRDVVVDIVPEFLVRDLKCNWLETILGCEQAYPRDGNGTIISTLHILTSENQAMVLGKQQAQRKLYIMDLVVLSLSMKTKQTKSLNGCGIE